MTTPKKTAKTNLNYSEAVDKYSVRQSTASSYRSRDYSNLAPNISGKPGLTWDDYYNFRPEEEPATRYKSVFLQCDTVYERCGLIWNIINLMTDFTIKGIRIVHPQKRKERLIQEWFARIEGQRVSERFVNYLYRLGNVVAQRYMATITKDLDLMYVSGAKNGKVIDDNFPVEKGLIPWRYIFIHPATCEVLSPELSMLTNRPKLGIEFSKEIKFKVKNAKTLSDSDKQLVSLIPDDVKQSIIKDQYYELKDDKTILYHFKKDDWKIWANPIIYPILDDINILSKLKLADICALDNASSKVRIIKLGNIEHKIAPTPAAVQKMSELLENSVGGGTIDIVWGPDVEIIETAYAGADFLGEEKYKPTLNNIYSTMGVPISLTSAYGGESGAGNNYMSLKTLTERLGYGRALLVDFWQTELEIFSKAMGWRIVPMVEFDQPILANEDTEKSLLIQLADRNLISDEIIQTKFNLNHTMEKTRLNRERKERTKEKRVKKAGPWFDPQTKEKLIQTALQTNVATPSQVGLDFEKPKTGEIEMIQKINNKGGTDPKKNSGIPNKGRPKGKKDTKKRKTKKFYVTKSSDPILSAWATEVQAKISDIITPVVLESFGKKNLRMLTEEEYVLAEQTKFDILCSIAPYSEINEDILINSLSKGFTYPELNNMLKMCISQYKEKTKTNPNIEQIRMFQSNLYCLLHGTE